MLSVSRSGDYESYLVRAVLSPAARDVHLAARALNLELSRLPETVSNTTIGQLRLQFWRDSMRATLVDGQPPREPICLVLHAGTSHLDASDGDIAGHSASSARSSLSFWLSRHITARAGSLFNPAPFPTLDSLESHAEKTYSSLLYATLAALHIRSVHADHIASHIGKALGIVATLRGIPVLAAPPRQEQIHTPQGIMQGTRGTQVLMLPLDVLARHGVREEEVFRRGPDATGIRDAVFETATRAHDHLLTARELLAAAKRGDATGVHQFEYEGQEGFVYGGSGGASLEGESDDARAISRDVRRAFPVFLDAVPALEYLKRLEQADFDVWRRGRHNWLLPWRLWQAASKQEI